MDPREKAQPRRAPRNQVPASRKETPFRLRRAGLSQPQRVLLPRHRDLHDPGRRLHARLRLLQRHHRPPVRGAVARRAARRGRGSAAHGAAARRGHVRPARRSARRPSPSPGRGMRDRDHRTVPAAEAREARRGRVRRAARVRRVSPCRRAHGPPRRLLRPVRAQLVHGGRGGGAMNIETTYLPLYLDYLAVEKGLAKNSLASYRTDLRRFAKWLEEHEIELEGVERLHVIRHFQALRGAGISARSVARALAAIRGMFRFLVAERHLKHDPTENIENPKLWTTLPKSLQPSEVEALLRAPDRTKPEGLRDGAMLELLYATGLRVSELIHVEIEDMVMDAGFLRTIGKGSKERIVPFGDAARDSVG